MLKVSSIVACLVLSASVASAAPLLCAPCLFYNGDFNGTDALSNEINTIVSDSRVYDNAVVGANAWNVTGIFTNNLIEPGSTFTGGHYEVRSGVSAGNGGTLVASGNLLTGAGFSLVLNGQNDPLSDYLGGFAVCNVPNLLLSANTRYFFSCTPTDSGSGRSFESTTSGVNRLGTHTANTAYWDSTFFSVQFVDSEDPRGCVVFAACTDFSFGVIGTIRPNVPEPATLLLMGLGALGVGRKFRRRLLSK